MPALKAPGARAWGPLAARAVFALLVVATIGAFFVTTRLKRSAPVVEQLSFDRYLSPNGDRMHDYVDIGFRIKRSDEVTVSLLSRRGDEVRTLVRDLELRRGRHQVRWDGRLDGGAVAPDGQYQVRVALRRQARTVTSSRKLLVDTKPPRLVVRYVSPDAISPDGAGTGNRATLRFAGPTRRRPTLLVYRTDLATPRLVGRSAGKAGSPKLEWDGRVGQSGATRAAPPGNYLLVVRTRDAAGNVGPVGLPPRRGELPGHPGVTVRYVAARGPLESVRAGTQVRFAVQNDGRRYRWRVRRLGSSRALERGSSRGRTLRVLAPRGRAGAFLLELRIDGHRYETPFTVQASRRRRVLVVLPATSWQARNALDTDGDGFADVLPVERDVTLTRPFAAGGLPPGFSSHEAPLLRFFDSARLRYDVTTDLALARRKSLPPIRERGILFAASPRFFSLNVGELVQSYVRSGGRVAWLGTQGFTQPVRVGGRSLELAPASFGRGHNFLGERLREDRRGGLVTVLGDRIDFFRGVGSVLGPFPSFEQTSGLPRGARLLASAGHEASRPSIVVYRDGRGMVARLGVDGFARSTLDSPDAARIMRRLWTLLSR